MAKIPLNFFRRISVPKIQTNYNYVYEPYYVTDDFHVKQAAQGTPQQSVYYCPFDRAGVIISALATNTSNTTQTIFAGLSTAGSPITTATQGGPIEFISNFQIAPYDTVNIVVNKLVLSQYDNLFVKAGNPDVINLTLSILETVNTP
jgi:hypothetical protein